MKTLSKENNIVSIKKCNVNFKLGIGTSCHKPNHVTMNQLNCYTKHIWIEYEGYWYLSSIVYSELDKLLNNMNKLYCKEQVVNFLLDNICISKS